MAILRDGKVFGERALETDEKRGATIKTLEPSILLVLMKEDFKHIIYVKFVNLKKKFSI